MWLNVHISLFDEIRVLKNVKFENNLSYNVPSIRLIVKRLAR